MNISISVDLLQDIADRWNPLMVHPSGLTFYRYEIDQMPHVFLLRAVRFPHKHSVIDINEMQNEDSLCK